MYASPKPSVRPQSIAQSATLKIPKGYNRNVQNVGVEGEASRPYDMEKSPG